MRLAKALGAFGVIAVVTMFLVTQTVAQTSDPYPPDMSAPGKVSTGDPPTIRLSAPSEVAVGDAITVSLFVSVPTDTVSGVHTTLFEYDKAALTFIGATLECPSLGWSNTSSLVNAGCGIPDQWTADPYAMIAGHDSWPVSGPGGCEVVVGGCPDQCFYDNWQPWVVEGEVLFGTVSFVATTAGPTVVGFPISTCQPYLTWIESGGACGAPDIVGSHLANDPQPVVTPASGRLSINVVAGTVSVGGMTWGIVKELYRE